MSGSCRKALTLSSYNEIHHDITAVFKSGVGIDTTGINKPGIDSATHWFKMAVHTLSSGTKRVPYMPMTIEFIPCPAPVLQSDFDSCRIPGGLELWANGGFYSPGECFTGYYARCTQTAPVSSGWPIQREETVVRCIPE
jgi:hypothetical protein